MKKKILIPVFVVLFLAVAAGGFFWWWQGREIKGSPEDYIIKETSEGTIVENKRAGLTVKVPEGWDTKKSEIREGSILIDTIDIEGKKWNEIVAPPLIKGCGTEISVVYKKMNFEEIKEKVKVLHWGLRIKSEEFEIVTINGWQSLKNNFESETLGSVMSIYIPIKNKLYDFDLYWGPDEKERCFQEFNKFLETVSIK